MDVKAISSNVGTGVIQDEISRNVRLSTVAPVLTIESPVSRAKQVCHM